jgi:hypothetical protein
MLQRSLAMMHGKWMGAGVRERCGWRAMSMQLGRHACSKQFVGSITSTKIVNVT